MIKKFKYGFSILLLFILGNTNTDFVNAEEKNYKYSEQDEITQLENYNYKTELKKEIKKAKLKSERYKNKLDKAEKKLYNLKTNKNQLNDEIVRVNKVVNLTYEKIKKTSNDINDLKIKLESLYQEIEKLEIELKKREDSFKERIQSSSKMRFMSYFEVVLSANSFSEMLNKLNHVKKIVKMDNQIIEEYLYLSEQMEHKKEQRESVLTNLNNKVIELRETRKNLLKENEKNKKDLDSISSDLPDLLNKYKMIKLQFDEANNLYIKLADQKKLIDNFSKYIREQTGDFGLHPLLEFKRQELISIAEKNGLKVITTDGLRTWEEQDRLYAQGRNKPGNIVTYAKGGQSWHNFGLAFDMAFDNGYGIPVWDNLDMNKNGKDDWEELGILGETIGLEWGGSWKFIDKPHFQYTFGKTLEEMRNAYVRN